MNEFENKGFDNETAEAEEAAEKQSELEASVSEPEICSEAEAVKAEKSAISVAYDYIETFCYALGLMMFLLLFAFRLVTVDGASMQHTLHHEDKLIISNLFYTPETGDIVVINPDKQSGSQEPIIKRVIATEGQTVYIDYKAWEVYVDGVKLDEPYINAMRAEMQAIYGEDVWMDVSDVSKYRAEFTVGEGMVFVMGDNRNNSMDSRSSKYGEMSENRILGRVIVRLTPELGFVE